MALYVHLTHAENAKSIQRVGIQTTHTRWETIPIGVFALPVMPNFYISHQWVRELKRDRRGSGILVGVYFRIPDDEPVWLGHFNAEHEQMTATQVAAALHQCENQQVLGFEAIIPRSIAASEIHKIRYVPQLVGWRYRPNSHGIRPCGCPFCQRGNYGGRKFRDAEEQAEAEGCEPIPNFQELQQRIVATSDLEELRTCLRYLLLIRKKLKVNPAFLAKLLTIQDTDLLESLAIGLGRFRHPETRKLLLTLIEYPDPLVKIAAVESLWDLYHQQTFEFVKAFSTDTVVMQALTALSQQSPK